ncbi:hypothetical protein GCM10008013_41520 [Paenibacillus segetis]|uniref:histidine kinase n=1 Tax=Paenibacillus segetis TaxID=1325360 RepID=A0ABQ1YT97_9BACL|nr:hypothetical protein GCM10008013_41520 [Paenibacillus segetis]
MEEVSINLNKMIRTLSGIETLRNDLINNFSHEFKTPIGSICGFAQMLKKDTLSEKEKREYIDAVIEESEQLASLIGSVLTLAKYENLEFMMDKTSFRLDEQVRNTIILMELEWSEKNITVNTHLDETVYNGNEDMTNQIWDNLLDNAIKFSHENGLINIIVFLMIIQTALSHLLSGGIHISSVAVLYQNGQEKRCISIKLYRNC